MSTNLRPVTLAGAAIATLAVAALWVTKGIPAALAALGQTGVPCEAPRHLALVNDNTQADYAEAHDG